ncbi:MAG: hypothetical protein KC652_04930 [Cyanobacteria bacterium HKST-UBA01]|nr:hypothetical protein [Cyanobacteria bacterium HKST-UBA01]
MFKATLRKAVPLLLAAISLAVSSAAMAKDFTIYDRQIQLMKDVNQAQKTSELTGKEAHKLRKKLAVVARKKRKMLKKDDESQLSTANRIELEKDLNDISVEIKKLSLEKRVEAQKQK